MLPWIIIVVAGIILSLTIKGKDKGRSILVVVIGCIVYSTKSNILSSDYYKVYVLAFGLIILPWILFILVKSENLIGKE